MTSTHLPGITHSFASETTQPAISVSVEEIAEEIRVQGIVQGVGFRPTVYRLAKGCGLRGTVCNDGEGVLIRVAGPAEAIATFLQRLQQEPPPLARIEAIAHHSIDAPDLPADFTITRSVSTAVRTEISPDAATCPQCKADILDPYSRWYRYPFTNCTHCGPRLSIIRALPYDRANTSMAPFQMCPQCRQEYEDVGDRRFHAQPVACHHCGPKAWLERADRQPIVAEMFSMLDDVDAACTLLQRGEIVAIKGIGGIHLACDATNETAVRKLRQRKRRYDKPLALMARDLSVIERYCTVGTVERQLLESPAAPIVLLQIKHDGENHDREDKAEPLGVTSTGTTGIQSHWRTRWVDGKSTHPIGNRSPQASIAPSVAPGMNTLGFMLPYTPLHHLMLRRMQRPIVLTSGNLSDEPQCIDNDEAREKLGAIADYFLLHNRDIVNRVDDSVVRVIQQQPQIFRRARGYASAPLRLPAGFEQAPPVLAMGGELKNTFCLVRDGQAILSQHLGDLENAAAFAAYQQTLQLYLQLFEHQPGAIALDLHPEYLSTKLGKELAADNQLPLQFVQHHHAHVAACMAENHLPIDTPPVLGIALDGLGYGEDGTLWGGEFLLADYRSYQRLACCKPVAMIGGEQAVYQPWRNTYAHLKAAFPTDKFWQTHGDLELFTFLNCQPRPLLNQLLQKGIHSPLASSCGRLFDAVAAALGICRESVSYEGQAAIALENLAATFLHSPTHRQSALQFAYPFAIDWNTHSIPVLEPRPLWQALLQDLRRGLSPAEMSARFHLGLAQAIATLTNALRQQHAFTHVILTGGVLQNQVLHHHLHHYLIHSGFTVLTHHHVPPNDGGLSLGQAAIATARHLP